jgi:hypothetical protein
MEAEESEIQMVPLEEIEEGDDKLAAAATDDLEVESEPADDALLPEEEQEEVTGDASTL